MTARLLAAAALAITGCHIFDPPPLADGPDAGDIAPPGGPDAAAPEPELDAAPGDTDQGDADQPVGLSDTCTDEEMPRAAPDGDVRRIDLSRLENDMVSFPGCGGTTALDGPDGFISIVAAAGERWHIEAAPTSGDLDVALYMLPTCDELTCQALVDRCPGGVGERFAFSPRQAGQYLLGVDGRGAGGEIDLYVNRTRCGNDLFERGEACDDGNLEDGDGCDSACRRELDPGERETEPNDRPETANAIRIGFRPVPVRIPGSLGGPCDTDSFVVNVPDGANLSAVFTDAAGNECAADHPAVEMVFTDVATGRILGFGESGRDGGACPSIESGDGIADELPAGRYQVTLRSAEPVAPFDYVLTLRVRRPPRRPPGRN